MATGDGERGGRKGLLDIKRKRPASSDSSEEEKRKGNEEFVVIFKMKGQKPDGGGFKAKNPVNISSSLTSSLGKEYQAKILANGCLRVCCKNQKQFEKAKKVASLAGAAVEVVDQKQNNGIKGVIYNVYAGWSDEEILDMAEGSRVKEARRFLRRDGLVDNERPMPVLLTFEGTALPDRVFFEGMSFPVRAYEQPPLRCFKCQKFGHVASACRGQRRCMRCGEEHDIKECRTELPKCCNCGGDHKASFYKCEHFSRAKKVQEVRVKEKISYADAVKRVQTEENASQARGRSEGRVEQQGPVGPVVPPDCLLLKKETLLSFIVDVLAGFKETKNRSDIIKKVVEASDRFLRVDMSPTDLYEYMSGKGRERRHASEEEFDVLIEEMEGDT